MILSVNNMALELNMSTELSSTTPVSARRRARIERELRVLRAMDSHLLTKEILWAFLTIPAVTFLALLVAAKAHWLSDSLPIAITAAVTFGAVVWWIGRRWIALASTIVLGVVLILLESIPSTDLDGFGTKEQRRIKLERAIARRQALLAQMSE